MKRSSALLLITLVSAAAQADPGADKVIHCMRADVPDTVRVDALEFASSDRQGSTQTLKGKLFAMHETPKPGAGFMHAMLRIEDPSQLKGASYLVRETDDYLRDGMFVYLPSIRRVRRVTGTFADGSLLGTSFSYYDFKQYTEAFGDLEPTLEKPETFDGRSVDVLSFKALPGVETHYSGARAWVDQKTCVVMKAEFYEGDKTRKRLTGSAAALTQSNGYWFLSQAEMVDTVQGTRTVVKMDKVTSGGELSSRYFDPTTFYLGN
jgi:hypothetical protein